MKTTLILSLTTILIACRHDLPLRLPVSDQAVDSFLIATTDRIGNHTDELNLAEQIRYLDSIYPTMLARHNPDLLSAYYYLKASSYLSVRLADSALPYIFMAETQALNSFYPEKPMTGVNVARAHLFLQNNQQDSALMCASAAYRLAKLHNPPLTNGARKILIDVYTRMGEKINRRKYIEEGLGVEQPPRFRADLLNNLAILYYENGYLDSAIATHELMMREHSDFSPYMTAINYENLGIFQAERGNTREALTSIFSALDLYRQLGALNEITYMNTGCLLGRQKQWSAALRYHDTAIMLARQHENTTEISDIFLMAARDYNNAGYAKAAFRLADSAMHYHRYQDSLALLTKAQELETRFGVQLKDQQIAGLDLSNKVMKAQVRQRLIIIVTLCVVISLVAVIAVLLIRRTRLQRQVSEYQLHQRLLRSQMEPHFIFNALSHLQHYLHEGLKEKTLAYLTKFSRLLRISLANARQSFVPLHDEIDALRKYLDLQQMNYEDRFTYSIDIYEGYDEDQLLVPPMLIQPFVENALVHGIRDIEYPGVITISIRREFNSVRCLIEDNGAGIQSRSGRPDKPSLSTIITRERLELLNRQTGQPAFLHIVDKRETGGLGVRVELQLPVRMPFLFGEEKVTMRVHHHSQTY